MSVVEPVVSPDEGFVDELKPGTRLLHGQYTIREYLNAGGFGITYLANDSLDRTVVIKECFPGAFCHRRDLTVQPRSRAFQAELRTIVRLFLQEARALSKLNHPNIVGVHHVFEENNTAYMALDYLEGRDLLDVITKENNKLDPDTVKVLLSKVLEAIGFVHDANLLHRDISPDNIIVTLANEPTLIDFGAAREQATRTTRALSALRVVKDGYSPQEFYLSGGKQGPSSDLYSVAATFYHLITGEIPPDSQTRIAAHVSGETDPYVPLATRAGHYDQLFCAALDRAMAILPKDRVQSSRDWIELMSGRKPMLPAPAISPTIRLEQAKTESRRPATAVSSQPLSPAARLERARAAVVPTAARRTSPLVIGGALAGLAVAGAIVWVGVLGQTGSATATATAEVPAAIAAEDAPSASTDMASVPAALGSAGPDGGASGLIGGSWSLDFPFATSSGDRLVIETVLPGLPAAFRPGTRIVAVNGKTVATLDEALTLAQATGALAGDGRFAPIRFDLADPVSGAVVTEVLEVPAAHDTAFANGLRLRTQVEDGAWVTSVATVPPGQAGKLQTGDVLVAVMPSQEAFADISAVRALLDRELTAGTSLLRVAVRRDEALWIAALAIAESES